MGASSSHHEPLDHRKHGTSFRRSASLRQSKCRQQVQGQANNKSSPRRMDKLRRSFRDSFRRRKETSSTAISEASKPHLWQTDEMDVRSGTCFFHVKYLGCVEVFESRGMQVCEEALKVLKNSRRRPVKAILYVSGDGLRVVEDDTKGLIVDQTIEKVSFCAPDRNHERGFSYICRDGTTRRWMCHGFLALKESGERLSHAVGCAFAVCLERKQKRDKECSVTMNFDLSNSTFTRTGSFRQQTLTEKLQDTTNTNNNVNVNVHANAATVAVTTTTAAVAATTAATVININNISTNYNTTKENIPVRTTPKISTHAIERPHATVSLLQRQGSFRGLSHLNHASPFKRQLSLRISDLPSNVERTRSHSLEYSLDPQSQFLHMKAAKTKTKTSVSPIPEVSPTLTNDSGDTAATKTTSRNASSTSHVVNTVSDQVSAMCQQLSQGLSLLSENDDYFAASKSNQTETAAFHMSARDIFSQKVNDFSQLIELQSIPVPVLLHNSPPNEKLCAEMEYQTDKLSSLKSIDEEPSPLPLHTIDTGLINNNNCSRRAEEFNSRSSSPPPLMRRRQMSNMSSVENIPLTPPITPPSPNDPTAQLPKAEQWLGKVAQLTMNAAESCTLINDIASVSVSPPAAKRVAGLALHSSRACSLSSAETAHVRTSVAAPAPVCEEPKPSDPFNIDWAALTVEPKPPSSKNTNPFLSSSPYGNATSDATTKTFQVHM